jgi:hypothetical protein
MQTQMPVISYLRAVRKPRKPGISTRLSYRKLVNKRLKNKAAKKEYAAKLIIITFVQR